MVTSIRTVQYGVRILSIPLAERSKARVCSLSLAGISDSNPAEGVKVCVVCVAEYKRTRKGIKDKRTMQSEQR